jgi:hypothetical protein
MCTVSDFPHPQGRIGNMKELQTKTGLIHVLLGPELMLTHISELFHDWGVVHFLDLFVLREYHTGLQ